MDKSSGFWLLVENFIDVIEIETQYPVVIYDTDGRIVKATDKSRIGSIHSGAQKMMKYGLKEYGVNPEEAQSNPLVREGYSLPIFLEEEVVGGFGITGQLDLARPIARIAVKMIEAWLREQDYVEKLTRSEKKYRTMFDQSLNGIFQTTLEGRVIIVNKAAAEILGYADEETMLRNVNDLATDLYVDPQSRKKYIELIKKNRYVSKFETKFRRFDGKIIDVSLNGKLLHDEETGREYIQGYLIDISSRKRAEELLRVNENNLRITLDSISDGVITTDTRGRVVMMNPKARQLTGWNLAEAGSMSLEEVYHVVRPEAPARRRNPAREILANCKRRQVINDAILYDRKGKKYRIAESGAPIFDSKSGITQGAVIVFRDVSDAFAQAELIRLSEQRLKNITANIPGVVFRLDVSGKSPFIPDYLSEQFKTTFGLDPNSKNVSEDFLASIPAEEAIDLLFSLKKAVEKRSKWHFEGRFTKRNGDMLWFSANAVPQWEAERLAYYGVFMDITDRKNWENALAASERRFRELFNEAPVMYVITEHRDDDWFILEANTTFLDLLDYRPVEVIDTPLRDYFSEESKASFFGDSKSDLLSFSTAQECSLVAKDGHIVYSLLRALPELDDKGNTWGSRSMFLDITAKKKAEEETERLQKALAQAQKMEAIGTLAGGIAHDFNNILSAVIGYSQLSLNELPQDCPSKNYINRILKAGERAKELVNQILAFSRQSKTRRIPMQVGPLLKESLQLLRATLPANIEILQQVDTPLENVLASPTQMQQIILNLCTNAYHAMEDTGGTLTVSLCQLSPELSPLELELDRPPQSCLRLTIEDTGTGIKQEDYDRIFEPYFTTKEKGKGTGLGLSVVFGIVKEYGGQIQVKSTMGEGTSFHIYLPTTSIENCDEAQKDTTIQGGTEKIIVVDDDDALLALASDVLTRQGYKVDAFNDCEEALNHFQKHGMQYSMLVTDYSMPKLNGSELYKQMRCDNPNLKVLLWSGTESIIRPIEEKLYDSKNYLEKPALPEKMARKVREILDRN
ncbi:MAG: PAS domain S-box protein [Desulfopila sp.]|jgi:PAS domain S-box-containing protein|nr:PAS domain S-box protein [Desulfopila sp.]